MSMIFVLPNSIKDFSKLELNLNEIISKPIPFGSEKTYIVTIPKFNISSSLNLKEVLEHIGLNKMFNKETADFTGKLKYLSDHFDLSRPHCMKLMNVKMK